VGGIVKAEGLGDGPAHGKAAIAKLRLTMPPGVSVDLALALAAGRIGLASVAMPALV